MNKLVLTLLFIFVSFFSFAQSPTFSGSVTEEESNVKMEAVIVKIEGTAIASTTDEQGNFEFKSIIPTGQQYITVTKEGYEMEIIPIDFIQGRSLNLTIELKLTNEEKKRRKKLNKDSDKLAKQEAKAKEKKLKEIRKETEKREKELAKKKKKLEKKNTGIVVTYGVVNPLGEVLPDETMTETFETNVSNDIDYTELQNKYATIIGVSPSEISNTTLYKFIDGWMGTPYKLGGSEKDGIDCSSFTQRLYQMVFEVYIARTAQAQADSKKIIQFQPPALPAENDFVFFWQDNNETDDSIGHVGIYLGNNKFISATSTPTNGKSGVKIDDLSKPYWKNKFCCFGRMDLGK